MYCVLIRVDSDLNGNIWGTKIDFQPRLFFLFLGRKKLGGKTFFLIQIQSNETITYALKIKHKYLYISKQICYKKGTRRIYLIL